MHQKSSFVRLVLEHLPADAREQALQRMISDAQKLGADAVVNVRFTTSVVAQGASEMLAFGTAVKLK